MPGILMATVVAQQIEDLMTDAHEAPPEREPRDLARELATSLERASGRPWKMAKEDGDTVLSAENGFRLTLTPQDGGFGEAGFWVNGREFELIPWTDVSLLARRNWEQLSPPRRWEESYLRYSDLFWDGTTS